MSSTVESIKHMKRKIDEIASDLRMATNLDDVKRLADELISPEPEQNIPVKEESNNLPLLTVFRSLLPGLVMVLAMACAAFGLIVVVGAAFGLLHSAWMLGIYKSVQ